VTADVSNIFIQVTIILINGDVIEVRRPVEGVEGSSG
jgi:hypothetical protein